MKTINISGIEISNANPLILIAGPCAIKSEEHALKMSSALKEITSKLNIPFIYKSSFDKANRTSIFSPRGPGLWKGRKIFEKIKEEVGCPILTDVHETYQCQLLKDVVDVLQIPAFLCRQTNLIIEATKTGLPVNIKKGQFMSPRDAEYLIEKVEETHRTFNLEGQPRILLTERGTTFGYYNLVCDMRSLPIMEEFGYPVIFDATHSVQQPSGLGGKSGGERKYAPVLARAATAVGVAGIFMEVHDNPEVAISDGPNMIYLRDVEEIVEKLQQLDWIAKN